MIRRECVSGDGDLHLVRKWQMAGLEKWTVAWETSLSIGCPAMKSKANDRGPTMVVRRYGAATKSLAVGGFH